MGHKQTPLASLTIGLDSDWKIMSTAARVLTDFETLLEARVTSTHRASINMLEYA